jgi:tRNA ligase
VGKKFDRRGRGRQPILAHSTLLISLPQLCDDSFEEHVLPYPPEKSGLHLHGLNHSIKAFHTLLAPEVDTFADEWGFIKTPTLTIESVDEVKAFTDEVAKSGKWNGEALEGFVVRTHISEPSGDYRQRDSPPYPPGSTFFFKVKFDEPYMMYRDWREVTKVLLSAKSKIPKSKLKRPETRLYVKWVGEEIKRNRPAFDNYNKGKGIIETRERFLVWMEGQEGKSKRKELEEEILSTDRSQTKFQKTIILPIAIPGCGTSFSTEYACFSDDSARQNSYISCVGASF